MQTIRDGHLVEVEVPRDQEIPLQYHEGSDQWEDFDRQKWPEILPEEVQWAFDNGYRGDCECQAIIWGYLDGVWYRITNACGASGIWVSGVILPGDQFQKVDRFIWPEALEAVEL